MITKNEFLELKKKLELRPKSINNMEFDINVMFINNPETRYWNIDKAYDSTCNAFNFEHGNTLYRGCKLYDELNELEDEYIYVTGNDLCDWLENSKEDFKYNVRIKILYGLENSGSYDAGGYEEQKSTIIWQIIKINN